ncbi:hypothetical protein V9T40_004169 [Parthenolecanium corni]|uniref:Uncharacterized protein n=1 Tax=Parthenolecanium corni TaxID=536013 RepID=A0AAN9TTK0_9HEMI
MAESSSSCGVGEVTEVSEAMAALDVSSPSTSSVCQSNPSEAYHQTDFWKKITIGVVQPADAQTVMTATRDLCHALLMQEPRPVVIKKAALLAAQFRNFDSPSELLVDHGQLQQLFAVNPDVRLDLTVAEGEGKRFAKGSGGWKDDFIDSVEKMNEKVALLFGPVFASVVLRMGQHGVRSVAAKMFKLGHKNYGQEVPLKIPSEQHLVSLLAKYSGAKPEKLLANTVYGGFIYSFHKQDLNYDTKGWLNFLALQSMRFSGMPLMSLIVEFVQKCCHNDVNLKRIYFSLTCSRAPHSWVTYTRVPKEYSDDPFWPYCRMFSKDVFQDLTYQPNHWLCNVTAFMLDKDCNPDAFEEWPTFGPRYENLVKFKDSSLHMTRDDYESAKEIHFHFEYERFRPLSNVRQKLVNDMMTELHGPNSKWHYY